MGALDASSMVGPSRGADAPARSATVGHVDAGDSQVPPFSGAPAQSAEIVDAEPCSELSRTGVLSGFLTLPQLPRGLLVGVDAYLGRVLTVRQRLDGAILHLASLRSQMESGAVVSERY